MTRTMQHFVFVICSILLLIGSVLVTSTLSETHNEDRPVDTYSKRKPTALWFGPRLGRKKRNNGDEVFRTLAVENDDLESVIAAIQNSPWAILAVNEGKRHVSGFTPRLGRDSAEDVISGSNSLINNDRWMQDSDDNGDQMIQRSPPFAPRLGRRLIPFSPRLGRDIDRQL